MVSPGAYAARAETIRRDAAGEARQMADECDARASVWGRSGAPGDSEAAGQFREAARALREAAAQFEVRLDAPLSRRPGEPVEAGGLPGGGRSEYFDAGPVSPDGVMRGGEVMKATYIEFPPEVLAALDGYVEDERRRTGRQVGRSEIVAAAVQAYLNPEPWVDHVPAWVDDEIAEARRSRE
jgi:hypothetical protein